MIRGRGALSFARRAHERCVTRPSCGDPRAAIIEQLRAMRL